MKPYAAIRQHIFDNTPLTLQELVAATGVDERSARHHLDTLRAEGRVRIAAWRGTAALYGWGSEPDAARPWPSVVAKTKPTPVHGRTRREVERLLGVMGKATAEEIETKAALAKDASRLTLLAMHRAGEAHIAGWARNSQGGPWSRVWALGPGEDVPRPSPVPRVRKVSPFGGDERTPGLQMHYAHRSVFAGGVNPWTGA